MNERVSFNDLVGTIASKSQVSKTFTRSLVKEMALIIQEGLLHDNRVTINGLGIFKLHETPERAGRSIQTGEVITIPAHRKVLFKPEKKLREIINRKYQHLRPQIIEDKPVIVKPAKPTEQKTESKSVDASYFNDLFEEEKEPAKKQIAPTPKTESAVLQKQKEPDVVKKQQFQTYKANDNKSDKKSSKLPIILSIIAILLIIFFYIEYNGNDVESNETQVVSTPEPEKEIQPQETAVDETEKTLNENNSKDVRQIKADETANTAGFQNHSANHGDNLWKLAETYYNNGYLWPLIFQANYEKIKNPDVIEEGITLKIPEFNDIKDVSTKLSKGHVLAYFAYKKQNSTGAINHLLVANKYDRSYIKEISAQIDEKDMQFVNELTVR